MTEPTRDEMESVLASLRQEMEKIEQTVDQANEVSETVTSKDRVVTATVDAQGRLTGLELKGRRWRDLPPKELCSKIVQTVESAQQAAVARTAGLMAGLLPPDLDATVRGVRPDFEAMLEGIRKVGKEQRDRQAEG